MLARGTPYANSEFRARLFGLDESHHPSVKGLALTGEWFVRSLANNQRDKGMTLMLSGPPGVGKTHVARAIYKYAGAWGVDIMLHTRQEKHLMPLWIDWPDIAETDDQSGFQDACNEVGRSQFFVLDDLGSESDRFKNGVAASRLRRLLAQTESKWIIATTNLTREQFMNFYDARVADRMTRFHWFTLAGVPSYRSKLAAV